MPEHLEGQRDRSEGFLRATLDALEANIAVLDEWGVIVAVNAAWDAFARDNGLRLDRNGVGTNYLAMCDGVTGADSEQAREAAAGIREVIARARERFSLEYPCHSPREKRWFVMRVTRFGDPALPRVVVAHENITERKAAEMAIRRSERLASIGTLAGGMAHEINNPIAALMLAARSAQSHLGDPERLSELLDRIVTSAQRCSGIVQSLLRSVHTGTDVAVRHDVNRSIREAVELLRPWAEEHGVELQLELADSLPPISAVAQDLRLALFNLGANAIQSCERGGHVSFRSEHAGGRIRVEVRDDGHGMTDDEQAHAFDPFFSRRLGQGGRGLGLTLCHGIVSDHDGSVALESGLGKGTRVTLTLPVA